MALLRHIRNTASMKSQWYGCLSRAYSNDSSSWHANFDRGISTRLQPWMKSYMRSEAAERSVFSGDETPLKWSMS